jgi:integrase
MSRGRPRLEIGTHGKIRFDQRSNGNVTAITEFRGLNGQNKKLTVTRNSKAAAERAIKRRAAEASEFVAANGDITIDSTVEELITFWLELIEETTRREATILTYTCTARKHVVPYLRYLRISELSIKRLSSWLNEVVKKNGVNRAKDARLVLNQALNDAVYLEMIPSNPLLKVKKLPSVPRNPPRALTMQQLALVREAVHEKKRRALGIGAPTDDRLICWFEVAVSNGARIGEVLALTRADLFLDEAKPFISISKTLTRNKNGAFIMGKEPKTRSSKRLLPISEEAANRLRYRLTKLDDLRPEALVFPTRNGTVWQPTSVRERLQKALIAEELEYLDIHPHLFRKSVGTAITNSLNIEAASILLGHSDVRQTQKAYWSPPKPIDLQLGNALEIPKYLEIKVEPSNQLSEEEFGHQDSNILSVSSAAAYTNYDSLLVERSA